MKALVVGFAAMVAGVVLALSWGADSALADGGIHVRGAGATTDNCAGCHRAHTAQAPNLLQAAQPALCYTCHGLAGAGANTSVQNGTLYTGLARVTVGSPAALRGGGFDAARINTADSTLPPANSFGYDAGTTIGVLAAPAAATSNHTNDGSAGTIWGAGAISAVANPGTALSGGNGLRCGSCHDPHGSGNYRALKSQPTGAGTSQAVTDEGASRNYSLTDYLRPLGGLVGAGAGSEMSNWCSTCHTRYLAPAGSGSVDSTDAIFRYRHNTSGGTLICTTCHVAHGTNASSAGTYSGAVAWPDSTAGVPATNSRLLKMNNRGICQKCHNK